MRTTVTIDDALYEKAIEMADPSMEKSDIDCVRARS
jgi:Arc/MetJ family transcription regulator